MLGLQCVQWSSHCLRKYTPLRLPRTQCRNISITQIYSLPASPNKRKQGLVGPQISCISHWIPPRRLDPKSIRFASTDNKTFPFAHIQPAHPSTASQPVPDLSASKEWGHPESSSLVDRSGAFEDTFLDGQPHVTEYIGYLKEMGLDYGWGSTATVQTLLEHIHIYTETPWWMSIALTVILIRFSIFLFYIKAQDTSARLAAIKPLYEPLDKRQRAAQATGDQHEYRAISLEKMALNEKFGIKPLRIFIPFVIQIPLGFGTFRLMRGMCTLPVPGFDQGGLFWLSDLTVPDPLYILPIATALTYYFNFKLGSESGSAATNLSPTAYKVFCYVLPAFTGIVAVWWPVGLQIPIFLNGIFAITQSTLFRQAWFRRICGIQPLGVIRSSVEKNVINQGLKTNSPSKGFIESFKLAYKEVLGAGKKVVAQRETKLRPGRTEKEIKNAKAYEGKIARDAAQRKFEAKQAKEAREEERMQRRML